MLWICGYDGWQWGHGMAQGLRGDYPVGLYRRIRRRRQDGTDSCRAVKETD